jgi:hypothetical protein
VDGLLGIGAAGGKSKSEGDQLKARLDMLRQERARRTPDIKKKEPVAVAAAPTPSKSTTMTNVKVDSGDGGDAKRSNRRKKKKKM